MSKPFPGHEEEKRRHIESGLEDVSAGRTAPHSDVKAWAANLLAGLRQDLPGGPINAVIRRDHPLLANEIVPQFQSLQEVGIERGHNGWQAWCTYQDPESGARTIAELYPAWAPMKRWLRDWYVGQHGFPTDPAELLAKQLLVDVGIWQGSS